MFRRNFALSSLLLIGLSLTGCSPSSVSGGATLETISGQCGENIPNTGLDTLRVGAGRFFEPVIQWGIKEGCFAKQGLQLEVQRIEDAEAAAAISSGSLDVMSSSPDQAIIFAANGGFDSRIIVADTGYSFDSLERAKREPLYEGRLLLQTGLFVRADSDFRTLSDLRGATIGLRTSVGLTARATLKALKHEGVQESEVTLLEIPTEGIPGAVESGQIDAGVLAGRYAAMAAEDGFRLIAYPGAYYYDPGTVTAWITNAALEKKRDAISAFERAIKEVNLLLSNPANEASWKEVLTEELDFDQAAADQTPVPNYWTKDITIEELQRASKRLLEEQVIKSEPDLEKLLISLE